MKKYYWLKLKKDFFKRHDITVIENMDNGKDYVLFYLKLLVESLSHEGNLRFSDTIPYDEKMLSSITNTNIDIVRSAIKLFTQLHMMEYLDDGTIYLNEVKTMIGNETDWAEKKRIYREQQKQLQLGQKKTMSDKSLELEKELDIEKDKEKKKNGVVSKTFIKPTVLEIEEYCKERNNNINANSFYDFYESKGWLVGKNKMKNWKAAVRTWESNRQEIVKSKDKVSKKQQDAIDYFDEKERLENERVRQTTT